MARKDGEYIAINELYGNLSNTASISKALRYNGGLGRRALLNGIVKFDHWITSLVVSDFSIGYEGGNVSDYIDVSSFGTDIVGENHNIGFSVNPSFISKNENNQEVSHTIEVTQFGSGEKVSVTCYQDSEAVYPTGFRYESYVSNTSIETASASGATLTLKIDGTVYIYRTYSDGSEEYYSKYDFSSVDAYVEYGYSLIGAEYSNGKVIVPSAGTDTYNGERVAFTISYYSYEVLGETYYEFPSINVYQEENKITGQEWGTSSSDYSLSITSSVSSFTSKGGTSTISVQCQQRYRDVYTSDARGSWVWADATASISTTYGDLSKSSITGSGTATLTVGKDYGTGTTSVVTAKIGNTSKSVSITQAKRVNTSTSYGEPSVVGTYQDTNIPAWGGYAYLMIDWSQTKYINYDNETYDSSPVTGTSRAVILGGTVQQTGASLQSDGGIYKSSCGTTVTPQRAVYTVTSYYFTANGVGKDVRPVTIHLGQAPNKVESTQWLSTYNISVGYSPSGSIANTGGTKTISVSCKENGKETYTSTATKDVTRSATAKLSTTKGTLSSTSVSDGGSTTLSVPENFYSDQTITVKATAGSNSSSASIIQSAASFEFESYSLVGSIPYEGGTISLSVISRVNGKACPLTSVASSLSGITISNPVLTDSRGEYTFSVTAGKNTTGAIRTFKITAVQQYSNDSLGWDVSQEKEAVDRKVVLIDAKVEFTNTSYSTASYSVCFDATDKEKYKGGTLSNVSVELNSMRNGSAKPIVSFPLESSLYVAEGTKSKVYSGTLENSTNNFNVYFIVRFDGAVQYASNIITPMD
jgi:hypothetical protein